MGIDSEKEKKKIRLFKKTKSLYAFVSFEEKEKNQEKGTWFHD